MSHSSQPVRGASGFRVVIFDWDGTLMDSVGSIVDCTRETLEELRLPAVGDSAIRDAIGLGLRETVERLAPNCEEEIFLQIVETYRHLWFDTYSHRPRLFPEVVDTLEELSQRGYLLAVATAKSRRGLNRDLRAVGLESHFHTTRTADEARSKPHPQMILDILEKLGVEPLRSLMIGDTVYDLRMARNAGASAAAISTGSHTREELVRASPLTIFESVGEVPRWLEDGAAETGLR